MYLITFVQSGLYVIGGVTKLLTLYSQPKYGVDAAAGGLLSEHFPSNVGGESRRHLPQPLVGGLDRDIEIFITSFGELTDTLLAENEGEPNLDGADE
jgi:hypothetical protein